MTIVGDGNQRRDFTHVSDVVEANVLAAKFTAPDYHVKDTGGCKVYNNSDWGQVYNIGTGINYSVNEIADMIGGDRINIDPRLGEARITLADNSKAKTELRWNPKIQLTDWIRENV